MVKFTQSECNDIISLSNIINGTYRDDSDRGISYTFYSIGLNESTKWIFDRFDLYLYNSLGISVIHQLDVIHLFKYSKGDKFCKHRDIYYKNQIYNVGACLNDDYEGGEFVLHEPEYMELPKETGTMYTFKHLLEHEVLEVTSGDRWSLIGFYFYEHLDLKKPAL